MNRRATERPGLGVTDGASDGVSIWPQIRWVTQDANATGTANSNKTVQNHAAQWGMRPSYSGKPEKTISPDRIDEFFYERRPVGASSDEGWTVR